ncbi:hypothetical protein [Sphingobacterium kyonggiense]
MEFLFLDTYYVDNQNILDVFKDYIIPIICGIAIPFVIFLFTSWNEYYKKLLERYNLREAVFFKNTQIIADLNLGIRDIDGYLIEINIDNNIINKRNLFFKNIEDILSIPFNTIVELFFKNSNNNSIQLYSNYEKNLVLVNNLKEFHNLIIQKNNEENLLMLKNLYEVEKEIMLFCKDKMNLYPDINAGPGFSYWNKNTNFVRLMMKNGVDLNTKYQNIIDLINFLDHKTDPDYFSNEFYKLVRSASDYLLVVQFNISNVISDLNNIQNTFSNCIDTINDFQPIVQINEPRKYQFWKYFNNS